MGTNYNITVGRLRGVCILVVIVMHYGMFFPTWFPLSGPAGHGYYGVTAFFVVSGYLITSNIIGRDGSLGNVSLVDFYVRRAARILPCLLLLLAALSALGASGIKGVAIPAELSNAEMIWYVLTFRFNVFMANYGGWKVESWLVLWSISIEEMFYFGYPLICRLAGRKALIVSGLLALVFIGPWRRFSAPWVGAGLVDYFGCFDAIALGALVALFAPDWRPHLPRLSIGLMGCALMLGAYLFLPPNEFFIIGPSVVAFGAAGLILASSDNGHPSTADPLALPGRYSYEIYLFHMPVFAALAYMSGQIHWHSPALYLPWVMAVVILAGCAIGYFYTEPLNALIRRLAMQRRPRRLYGHEVG